MIIALVIAGVFELLFQLMLVGVGGFDENGMAQDRAWFLLTVKAIYGNDEA